MSKNRTIAQQLNYAIAGNNKIGESKHQYMSTHGGSTDSYLFSVENFGKFCDLSKSLSKFMKANFPEVREVRDITNVHLQCYMYVAGAQWDYATAVEKISELNKLFTMIRATYKCKISCNPRELVNPVEDRTRLRVVSMPRGDLERLRESFAARNARTEGRIAIEITCRVGLRIKEIAWLRPERINTDLWVVEVREGGKNGKFRDVPIKEKDREFFAELKERTKNRNFVCNGYKEDSLNKAIRREMKRIGIDDKYERTTNHTIRKMYAKERMQEEIDSGKSFDEAWPIVQRELGHGYNFRKELFEVYVLGIEPESENLLQE